MEKEDTKDTSNPAPSQQPEPDENMSLLIYGNLTIRDTETGEVLVNKRF